MQETVAVDVAIIGAGILGLTLAYEVKNQFPDCEIAVFDKEPYLGEHSSGRNSGVLHAGLYYPNQSLKHLLCLEGNQLWKKLSLDLDIGFRNCGKLIFSNSESEDSNLHELFEKAVKNDVPIKWASDKELQVLKTDVNAFNAISSPSTSILNVSEALTKLKYNLEARGVNVFLASQVDSIISDKDKFLINFPDFDLIANKVINVGGLGAINLREKLGLNELENYFVRGHYLSTSQKLKYETLYYPIPPADLKGLGVHSTIDLDGKVKFGPNTEEITEVSYTPPKNSLDEMEGLIGVYFKNIDKTKLHWDYAGCRSKIRFKNDKKLFTDFWIKSPIKNYIECLGIESPGLTSAPAIARLVAKNFF